MSFDFDEIIDFRGTHSEKWDEMERLMGVPLDGGIPMWVADMDFRAAPSIQAALEKQLRHGVHSYYDGLDSWRGSICDWMRTRHGWAVEPNWVLPSAGMVSALGLICQAFSAPGEAVVVFSPVYHAFHRIIRCNDRRVFESELVNRDGRYFMDLDQLGRELPADARIVFFCSPHNPGGRVWEVAEIRALAAFCADRGLILVSDEAHQDLVYTNGRHAVTAVAAPEIADRLITVAATTKTFNIAGIHTGQAIIEDAKLREAYAARQKAAGLGSVNKFGMLLAEAAYAGGAPWLEALLPYLQGNRDLLESRLAADIPGARPMHMQATYLGWVDLNGVDLPFAEVARRVKHDAKIATSPGAVFGKGGAGFLRFNFACRRALLTEALDRLAGAFADLR